MLSWTVAHLALFTLAFLLFLAAGYFYYRSRAPTVVAPSPLRPQPITEWHKDARSLSSDPQVLVFENFLSADEMAHLRAIAEPHLRPSTVKQGQADVQSSERTSSSAMLQPAQDEIVARIEARCAAVAGYPVSHFEPLQVLRYQSGQQYSPHYDYFQPDEMTPSGQRHGTFFIYLNDVAEGGETHFPNLDLSVAPRAGSAAFWYNCRADGTEDARMLHGGKPPQSGEKWGVNVWFRQAPLR